MKRTRDKDFEFPYPFEKMLTTYRDVLYSILIRSNYKKIQSFEKSSKDAKKFVKKRFIWKMLFKRDYYMAYKKFKLHSEYYTNTITFFSQNKESDIWKRYYELMKIPLERFNQYSVISKNSFKSNGEFDVYLPKDYKDNSICYIVSNDDVKMLQFINNIFNIIDKNENVLGQKVEGNFKSIDGIFRYQLILEIGARWKIATYSFTDEVLVSFNVF